MTSITVNAKYTYKDDFGRDHFLAQTPNDSAKLRRYGLVDEFAITNTGSIVEFLGQICRVEIRVASWEAAGVRKTRVYLRNISRA